MTDRSRRSLALLAGALAGTALVAGPASAQSQPQKNKVVLQVSDNDPAKWNLVLNNLRNLQQDLGDEGVEAEVVAYGPGIGMLKADSPVAKRVADALKAGVQVGACENTMRNQKLARADMHPNVSYVPAGVTEIVQRQREGWAYLRP